MSDKATFQEIGNSDECIYGPRKLLLLGYRADEQARLRHLLAEHTDSHGLACGRWRFEVGGLRQKPGTLWPMNPHVSP